MVQTRINVEELFFKIKTVEVNTKMAPNLNTVKTWDKMFYEGRKRPPALPNFK